MYNNYVSILFAHFTPSTKRGAAMKLLKHFIFIVLSIFICQKILEDTHYHASYTA